MLSFLVLNEYSIDQNKPQSTRFEKFKKVMIGAPIIGAGLGFTKGLYHVGEPNAIDNYISKGTSGGALLGAGVGLLHGVYQGGMNLLEKRHIKKMKEEQEKRENINNNPYLI